MSGGGSATGTDARDDGTARATIPPAELVIIGTDRTDTSCLLLRAPDGSTYRLRAGSPLRAALRALGPATGSMTPVTAPLRPRDIQARIRAGENAADVAAAAGVPVEQVRRYEGPVLAERAHIAARAREARVRADGQRPRLIDLVSQRLTARGVDAAAVAWDAWRREGARWAVQAAFHAAGRDRHAQWFFDPATSVLEPLDDEARWLCAASEHAPRTGRRLSSVRVYDVEDDGGVHEILTSAADHAEPPATDEDPEVADPEDIAARTMELLDALRDRRGRRMPVMDLADESEDWEDDDEDDLVNALLDLPPSAHPPASLPLPGDVELLAPAEPRLRMVPASPREPDDSDDSDDDEGWAPPTSDDPAGTPFPIAIAPSTKSSSTKTSPTPLSATPASPTPASPTPAPPAATAVATATPAVPAPAPAPTSVPPSALAASVEQDEHEEDDTDDPPASRGRRRPSVPSWDEILFGGPRLD